MRKILDTTFLNFIDGKLTLRGKDIMVVIPETERYLKISYDIDELSKFGGYVGAEIKIEENVFYSIEYQHTAAADGLGMSLIWRFY